jgi:glutamate decarboxylase
MALHRHVGDADEELKLDPLLSAASGPDRMPRLRIPEAPTPPEIAARLVRGNLILDGSAGLNLATFVTTWMEPEASSLMADTFDKNMIDKDEYPQTAELELRCINILADLWHADANEGAVGTSTTGSSEAAMLGGMALRGAGALARARRASRPTSPTS